MLPRWEIVISCPRELSDGIMPAKRVSSWLIESVRLTTNQERKSCQKIPSKKYHWLITLNARMQCEITKLKKPKMEGEKDEKRKKERYKFPRRWANVLWNTKRLLLFHKHVIRTAETIFKYRQGRKYPAYCNKKQSEWPYNDIWNLLCCCFYKKKNPDVYTHNKNHYTTRNQTECWYFIAFYACGVSNTTEYNKQHTIIEVNKTN